MKKFKKLNREEMKNANGGLKWTGDGGCKAGNVEDRRPGADPVWWQKVQTFAYNFWYCDQHL